MKVSKKLVHDALPDVVEDLYRQINELVQRVDYLSMDVSRLAARLDAQDFTKTLDQSKQMFSDERDGRNVR
jgi:regulator of replication initiation timing